MYKWKDSNGWYESDFLLRTAPRRHHRKVSVWQAVAIAISILVIVAAEASAFSLVGDINATANAQLASFPQEFVDVGERTFFVASDVRREPTLWVMTADPMRPGHGLVPRSLPIFEPHHLTALAGGIVASGRPGPMGSIPQLMRSDGTEAGTFLLHPVEPDGPVMALGEFGLFLESTRNRLPGRHGLWRTDGTREGTFALVSPGSGVSFRAFIGSLRGVAYLVGEDAEHGAELWRSDGTVAGTYLAAELTPSSASSAFGAGVVWNEALYFVAADRLNGLALFRMNDDTGAIETVLRLNGSLASKHELTPVGDKLFLSTATTIHVLRSDGMGSIPIPEMLLPMGDDTLYRAGVGGRLFFWRHVGSARYSMWSSDGTLAGTQSVAEGLAAPGQVVGFRGAAYFEGGDSLWRSDGTSQGTFTLRDFSTGVPSSFPSLRPAVLMSLTAAAGGLVFGGRDPAFGVEPWWSDGTAAGTFRFADLAVGTGSADPEHLTEHAGILHFVANDGMSGKALWHSGGNPGTTRRRWVPPAGAAIRGLLSGPERLLLSLYDEERGYELWQIADDSDEAEYVGPAVRAGSNVRFELAAGSVHRGVVLAAVTLDARSGWQVVAFDLESGSSETLLMNPSQQTPGGWTHFAGRVYFMVAPGAAAELFVTDGTVDGTGRVEALRNAHPRFTPLLATSGAVYASEANRILRIGDDGLAVEILRDWTSSSGLFRLSTDRFAIVLERNNESRLWIGDETRTPQLVPASIELAQLGTLIGGIGGRILGIVTSPLGYELWASDGTTAGTERMAIFPTRNSGLGRVVAGPPSSLDYLTLQVWFGNWVQTWRSDGTSEGTGRLGTFIGTGGTWPGELIPPRAIAGAQLFMVQAWPEFGRELFHLDLDGLLLDVSDCSEDGAVAFDDLEIVLRIALGHESPLSCVTADLNLDGAIGVEDVVSLVQRLAESPSR